MKTVINIESVDKLAKAAETFLKAISNKKVIAFYGSMGAGKTTFIKSLCESLGSEDNINSPTFSIINEYLTKDDEVIYHMDCYRIEKIEEANNIGISEYLYSGNFCFIEWPENIESLLPDSALKVTLNINADESRTLEFSK